MHPSPAPRRTGGSTPQPAGQDTVLGLTRPGEPVRGCSRSRHTHRIRAARNVMTRPEPPDRPEASAQTIATGPLGRNLDVTCNPTSSSPAAAEAGLTRRPAPSTSNANPGPRHTEHPGPKDGDTASNTGRDTARPTPRTIRPPPLGAIRPAILQATACRGVTRSRSPSGRPGPRQCPATCERREAGEAGDPHPSRSDTRPRSPGAGPDRSSESAQCTFMAPPSGRRIRAPTSTCPVHDRRRTGHETAIQPAIPAAIRRDGPRAGHIEPSGAANPERHPQRRQGGDTASDTTCETATRNGGGRARRRDASQPSGDRGILGDRTPGSGSWTRLRRRRRQFRPALQRGLRRTAGRPDGQTARRRYNERYSQA
jgi:hypothetical protein